MSKRGKKDCPNCNTEIGARSHLCSCGYYFPTKEIRKDLLKKKNTIVAPKTYTALGQGRKKCPGCEIIIGGVTKKCPQCSFDFVLAKKQRDEKEVKKEKKVKKVAAPVKINPEVEKLLSLPTYKGTKKLTPKEHAERILSYGKKRARSLLKHLKESKWSHVDWEMVRVGIG